MSRSKKSKSFSVVVLLVALVLVAYSRLQPETLQTNNDNPAATATISESNLLDVIIPTDVENLMLYYEGFNVAFNPAMHQPNYSAWQLTSDRIDGEFSRKDVEFQADENVAGCATLQDYKRSGFDRGHMAPAADMKWSKQAMADCHYLTNMCPQDQRLNSGAWATIEKSCRKWAQKYGTLYIIAGPVLSDRLTRSIGLTPVPVPERFFKVIVAPEANPPMGIAFLMPNGFISGGAQETVTTIDQIEAITGFDFFSALPDDIENNVEQQHTMAAWNH